VVPTAKVENLITVELVEITSMEAVQRLCEFEFSVGYELADIVIDEQPAGIFIFGTQQAAKFSKPEKLIPGGDWVRFAGSLRSHA
jgi:hypothetical protein